MDLCGNPRSPKCCIEQCVSFFFLIIEYTSLHKKHLLGLEKYRLYYGLLLKAKIRHNSSPKSHVGSQPYLLPLLLSSPELCRGGGKTAMPRGGLPPPPAHQDSTPQDAFITTGESPHHLMAFATFPISAKVETEPLLLFPLSHIATLSKNPPRRWRKSLITPGPPLSRQEERECLLISQLAPPSLFVSPPGVWIPGQRPHLGCNLTKSDHRVKRFFP